MDRKTYLMKIICITPFNKHDYLTDCVIQGLKELGHELINTDPGNGFTTQYRGQYVIDQAKDADAALAFWSKLQLPGPRYHLMDHMKNIPKAYIDGSEYNQIGHPRKPSTWLAHDMLTGRADYYFKRECMPADIAQGVLPLPFAARDRDFKIPIEANARTIDIFAAFGQTMMDPIRSKLQSMMIEWRHWAGGPKIELGPVDNEKYQQLTASAKICVNAHGGGQDCMRFWEIMAAGAACFTQKFDIVMPHPYTDGWNMIEFSTVEEFKEKAKSFLQHPEMLERIALAGYKHTKKYHTCKARAQYILENMGLLNA